MKKGLTLSIVLLIVAAVLAVVGFVQKGDVQKKLDAAELKLTEQTEKAADLDAATAELETAKASLASTEASLETAKTELQGKVDALTAELETAKATAETAKAELQGKIDNLTAELETAKSSAAATLGETEAARAELQTRVDALTAELEAAKSEMETAKAGAVTQADSLNAQVTALMAEAETVKAELTTVKAELETLKAAPAPVLPVVKHGLGMVTSIGSVAEATAEKAGAAQVNTTVCSVTLDENNVILSVTWDVQQTKIQFSLDGKPVELPAEPLTKLEKGEAYGMKKASAIGKEWFEQIAAFGEYAVGKTVEEVLALEVFERDAQHKAVPAVADLTASVTISVGDYLASLAKAAANAK